MQTVINELNKIVHDYARKFSAMSVHDFSAKKDSRKWSKKEVIGHLIDSAQNNLRRFIVTQYEPETLRITYDQDFWVAANSYQAMSTDDLIALWRLLNDRIATVLQNMPETSYKKTAMTSKLDTLEFLAEDYVKHMKHHINQVIPGSFDIVYK
jgi:hypothetical protein